MSLNGLARIDIDATDLQRVVSGIEDFINLVETGRLRAARELLERMPGFLRALILVSKAQSRAAPRGVQKNHYRAMGEDLNLICERAERAEQMMGVGKHVDALMLKNCLGVARCLVDLQHLQDERIARKEKSNG